MEKVINMCWLLVVVLGALARNLLSCLEQAAHDASFVDVFRQAELNC